MTLISKKVTDTYEIGRIVGRFLQRGDVVALSGPLGAGKTVFTKGLAVSLGIAEDITSPTYTIVSVYEGSIPFYHIDLYRIDSEEEFELLGGEDYLYSDGVTALEWSERIEELLDEETWRLVFILDETGERRIQLTGPSSLEEKAASALESFLC